MTSLITGVLLVWVLSSGARSRCRHDLFRLLLGAGLGVGLCSCSYFLGILFRIPVVWLELLLLMGAGIAAALRWRSAECPFCGLSEAPVGGYFLTAALAIAFLVLLILDLQAFIETAARSPEGQWDAWAIWNLRARFLYRDGGAAWRDGFAHRLNWSHPDYPLLLPAFVAAVWKTLGHEARMVPIALGAFFSFGSVGLMAASVSILRGVRLGLLAGITLAATPVLFVHGASQYADVPLAFFVLATLTSLALAAHFDIAGIEALAGIAAALAAWTKNEGLLWFACFLLARIIVTGLRRLPAFLAGAAPVLAIVFLFKTQVAPSSDIFGATGRTGMMERILDSCRYGLIARKALLHMWYFGPLLVSPFVILAIFLLVSGIRPDRKDLHTLRTATLALLFTAAGYFMTYVLHPLDLSWLLMTSIDRLILQLWPAVVFTFLLAVGSPAESGGFPRMRSRFRLVTLRARPRRWRASYRSSEE